MSSRDEILNRLRQQAREAQMPDPWRSRRHFDDPAGRFVETLKANKGEAHRAGSQEEALALIGDILHEIGARRVVTDGHPLLVEANLAKRWPELEWSIAGHSEGDLRAFAAAADVGLSMATAALAETGTVVVATDTNTSRLTGLLPPIHLVLASTSHLSTDIFTWTAERPEVLPSFVTLISGPSKTADIEQTMAVGVHGPGRLVVVLFDE